MPGDLPNRAGAIRVETQLFPVETEAALVETARHDPAAFGELYRRYVVRIYRYLYCLVAAPEPAEELTAQVFCAAWESLPRYQEEGNFAAWLFRIARNKSNDFFRQQRPDLPLDEAHVLLREEFDPLADMERDETLRRLASLVNRLAPDQMELLRLRFAADLSFAQIASLSGCSEAAVKMSLYRLLERLKSEWEKCDE